MVVWQLGWVDLDLGSSPSWWAATVATYYLSRMVEHPKSKSTEPSPPGYGSPCTLYRPSFGRSSGRAERAQMAKFAEQSLQSGTMRWENGTATVGQCDLLLKAIVFPFPDFKKVT